MDMELKLRRYQEIYIIDVSGEMDLYNSYKLKDLMVKMITRKIKSIIINLENTKYIDSSGIGTLIFASSTLKKVNIKLAIVNIQGTVKKVIELAGLTGFFPITVSLEEAIRKMG
jgi:anti-sigma B factor antagonist